MFARQAALVTAAVRLDVLGVAVPEPKDGAFDLAHAAEMSVAHRPGAVVGVRARAVPVPGHGFRVQGDDDVSSQLAHALKDVSRGPELVAGVNPDAGSHLEFPLSGHHLRVEAAHFDAGVVTRAVVRLGDVPPEHAIRTHAAVVRSLGRGVPAGWPSQRPTRDSVEKRVFLLYSEPRLLGGDIWDVEDSRGGGARVRGDGIARGGVRVTHDEEVAAPAEHFAAYTVDGAIVRVGAGDETRGGGGGRERCLCGAARR